jgi:hypothetical protein
VQARALFAAFAAYRPEFQRGRLACGVLCAPCMWRAPLFFTLLAACVSGQITSSSPAHCPAGQGACGGTCVDTASDPANCGACGNVCDASAGLSCSGGQCVAATPGCSYCRDGSGNACNEGGSCGTDLLCKGGYCILGADLYDVIPVRLSRNGAGGTFNGYDLILIAGQSNAVGFGCGPYTPLHAEQDPLIDQIKPDLSIIPASDPLWHNDGTNKVGFGLAFARLYAQESLAPNRRVLIVPVARGATSILEWNKADEGLDFSSTGLPSSPELWSKMITRLDAALAAGSGTNRVAAVLWQQGESDYNFINDPGSPFHASMSSPDMYRQRLERWISDLRAAEPATAGAPFIRGEIPRFWPPPPLVASDPQRVTQLNAAIASASISNAGLAQTGGLLSGANFSCMDAAHINAMSQTEFGRRFYDTYRAMKGLPAQPLTSDLIRTSYVDQSIDMGCAYFNPDAIKQLPEETIRWLAALMPSGLTLHEHYLTARQHGYFGPLGQGGHATWLALSPNLQSDFDAAVSAMANADMSPSWPTWRDHHVARRAAGYEGLFLCGGDACFQAGQCDSLGRRL